jgi:D-3-phosphoglycerate dehydrogenase / 2-oxoglutarate reductase
MRVLVTEKLSEAGLELLRERFQVDVREDLARGDLAAEIAPYDALVIRSATPVTAEVLDAASQLKVVARAGIGVDNVDVEAATRRGVLVVNAPQSNTISAAEHTMALLLAQARNVPQADRELHAGRWDKERWRGVELAGKTLGLIGLGRVGTLVASRAQGFGMRVIAFDPYVSGERAKELGVDVMPTLESLLVQADFVSIHLPGSPDTLGLIGEHQLAMCKRGARLVNTSRGGIVDEEALAKALEDGRLAGAALDVFAVEPATDSPLFGMEHVVVTPHLGASTIEAQDKAGRTVAEMVRLALEGQFVPYAVNVSAGAEVSEAVRPFVGLAERLGSLAAGLAEGGVRSIVASYLGRVAEHDTRVLTLAILKGILGRSVNEPVSFVNAPLLARDRGLTVSEMRSTGSQDYVSQISLRAQTESESEIEVAGTLLGKKNAERVIQVWDFEVEIEPAPHMLFFVYEDRPGIIGRVGTILGEHAINIATMEVGRKAAGGDALMGLTVDSPVPPDVLKTVADAIDAHTIRAVTLDTPSAVPPDRRSS